MTVNLSALAGAGQQFFDNNGVILSGGKLYSYAAGTSTPQATYTSASGSTAHSNPIVLNSAGRVATGEIWLTAGSNYKFALYTSANVLITTWDNITGINGTGIATNAANVQYDPAGTGAVATTVQAKLRQTRNVIDFGAVGDGSTDNTTAIQNAMTAAGNGTLLFPDGVFNISGALNVPVGLKIQGTYRLGQSGGTEIVQTAANTTTTTTATPFSSTLGNYYTSVGSTTGISVGSLVKIAGAGQNGADYYGNVTVIGASQVTLSVQFYTAVTGATMTIYSGTNIFNLASVGAGGTLGNAVSGILFRGGYNQISSLDGGVWMTIDNCSFISARNAGIYFGLFTQQWFLTNCEFNSNATGIYYYGQPTGGGQCLFDKNRFYNLYLNGHLINAINISLPSGTGQANEFYSIAFIYSTQDGIVFGGGLNNITCIGLNTESNGYLGTAPAAPTTGSISASSNTLTVASATGFANGQTLTVQGAGALGFDLQAVITNIVGTTITLSTVASFTVSSAEVTNYVYSDVKFMVNGGVQPQYFNIIASELGIGSSVGFVLYGIKGSGGAHSIVGYYGSRPFTFSGSASGIIQSSTLRDVNISSDLFSQNLFVNNIGFDRSQLVSPPGTNIVFGLQAANAGAGTGFGQWQGYRADPNRTKIWGIDGTSGTASFTGGVSPGAGYVGAFSSGTIFYASGSPQTTSPWSTLPWVLGSKAFNSSPAVGQPKGWVCTVAGTPGTWVSEGNL
jgi:hypothetical protein